MDLKIEYSFTKWHWYNLKTEESVWDVRQCDIGPIIWKNNLLIPKNCFSVHIFSYIIFVFVWNINTFCCQMNVLYLINYKVSDKHGENLHVRTHSKHVYANHSWLDLESEWCSYAKIFGWRMIGNCTRTKNNQRWT